MIKTLLYISYSLFALALVLAGLFFIGTLKTRAMIKILKSGKPSPGQVSEYQEGTRHMRKYAYWSGYLVVGAILIFIIAAILNST